MSQQPSTHPNNNLTSSTDTNGTYSTSKQNTPISQPKTVTAPSTASQGVDIFQEVPNKENFYRHKQQPFPTYVLDRIAKESIFGGDQQNDDDNHDDLERKPHFSNNEPRRGSLPSKDPFVRIFKDPTSGSVDWSKFQKTIQGETAYTSKQMKLDSNGDIMKSYQLDTEWKGLDNLNAIFQFPSSSLDDVEKCRGTNHLNPSADGLSPRFTTNGKYRSKAVYWITENKDDWKPKLAEILMSNSYIPLFFRAFTLLLTCVALGLACRIMILSNRLDTEDHVSQQPSTIMAITVQSVAIVYLLYISFDEFTSKPLGLRDPRAKIRLILYDLLFIIFSSANLALSFNTLYDSRWVCRGSIQGHLIGSMCEKQRSLSAFLFLILVVWCITFTISVVRVVQMVTNDEHSKR